MGGGNKLAHSAAKVAPAPSIVLPEDGATTPSLDFEQLKSVASAFGNEDAAVLTVEGVLSAIESLSDYGVLEQVSQDVDVDLTSGEFTTWLNNFLLDHAAGGALGAGGGTGDEGEIEGEPWAGGSAPLVEDPAEESAPVLNEELAAALAGDLATEENELAVATPHVDDAAWQDALTPIPDSLPEGDPRGVALLVGGADIEDASASILSYKTAKGPREVLFATVREEAEHKLLESIGAGLPTTSVEEVETKSGRLPFDSQHQIYEQTRKLLMDVNRAMKNGLDWKPGLPSRVAALRSQLDELKDKGELSASEEGLVVHYAQALDHVEERIAPGYATPYGDGGKIPYIEPYEGEYPTTVTKQIPVALDQPIEIVPSALRQASRIGSSISDGEISWNGQRNDVGGKEYVIDLGAGYQAVYHPYDYPGRKPSTDPFSLRGRLEITAPAGGGKARELVDQLGRLGIVNRPMTKEEGEWAYLQSNITAQSLAESPAVLKAMERADGLADAVEEILLGQAVQKVVVAGNASDEELMALAKRIRLEAEAKALPDMVHILRDGVAKAKQLPNGDALASLPGYDPTPRRRGNWLAWERFDVAGFPEAARELLAGKSIVHTLHGGSLVDVLRNGKLLAATERRKMIGIKEGTGVSESADMVSGGASSVFTRIAHRPVSGTMQLCWDDPTVLLRRADWYAYRGDHFGSLNSESGYSTSGRTRSLKQVAGYSAQSNEIMFKDGIDLEHEPPSRVLVPAHSRSHVLSELSDAGITAIGGRPIEEVVVTS
jgi:hypothetical protein